MHYAYTNQHNGFSGYGPVYLIIKAGPCRPHFLPSGSTRKNNTKRNRTADSNVHSTRTRSQSGPDSCTRNLIIMEATAKLNAVSRYQTETAFCRLRALRAVIASLCVLSCWMETTNLAQFKDSLKKLTSKCEDVAQSGFCHHS